ncbi:NAD(P)-binding domain-containing protein [Nibribacter ruber]|uniref:NAD(P)-binding domain-containing protein n=1 Tax=Nibribacter ruber TaxID=2698458 RepID=A0A6P1P2T1_9BACT|nr:NAD(P)/FAD-dependent oxidoreductase [Nibribacter ruber]QHL88682.1 NAD(P)-binding domain-containing protein [Nibribacter ruber]
MHTENLAFERPEAPPLFDVLVIGAGQAGLAMGYYLHLQRKKFLLLEAASLLGHSWQNRYDSLRLFTPVPYCHLPGWPLLLPKNHYPTKEDIARYLQAYAAQFQLPIALNQQVLCLRKVQGIFEVMTATQTWRAAHVVVATGPFQVPYIPAYPTGLSPQVVQLHSAQYKNPSQIPAGRVLVVGAGNSGAQIAAELAKTHEVHLSVKRKPRFSSLKMLGKSVFWWATKTGAIFASPSSRVGKKLLQKGDIIYGRELERLLKTKEVLLKPEIQDPKQAEVLFKDGSQASYQAIVWATGFRPDYSWLQVAGALAPDGSALHKKGMSPVAGLYYVGLSWQRSRSSALLLGAGRDAQFIARHLG